MSINDFVTKAVAHALVECPDINTLYQNGQVSFTISFSIMNNCVRVRDSIIILIINGY